MIAVADIIALPAFDGIELVVSVEGACGAEVLHLHPDTIRYRMRQAKAALGMSETPDREFAFFLGLVLSEQTNPWSR